MRAKKCDRCGSYYDKNNKFTENGWIVSGMELFSDDGTGLRSTIMDLCDNCIADLKQFLKEGDNSYERA